MSFSSRRGSTSANIDGSVGIALRYTSRGKLFWCLYLLRISIRVPVSRQRLDRTFGTSSLTRRAAYSVWPMRRLIFALSITAIHASTIYSVTGLGSMGGSSAAAFGINASGMAFGWAENAIGSTNAFASVKGGLLHLPGLSGAPDSFAYGVNDSGVVVGISYVNGPPNGVIWNGAASTDLGPGMFATGINDPGAAVGSNGHAFLLVNGVYQDLGALPGGDWSTAYGIDKSGEVAGYGDIAPGVFRAFYWTASSGLTQLGTFGGRNSYAAGIND
jgi:uncharacterized membrane protein